MLARRPRSVAWVLLLGLLALPGTACDGQGGPPALPDAPLVLEGVPDVVQSTDWTCGPAALVAVLAYYGIPATEEELAAEAQVDPATGALLGQLVDLAAARALQAEERDRLTVEDLESEVAAGRPVIVFNQSWRSDPRVAWRTDWDDGHYLVVIGVDAGFVYLEDPSLEDARGWIWRQEFLERWHGWTDADEQTQGQAILLRGPPMPGPAPTAGEVFEPVE